MSPLERDSWLRRPYRSRARGNMFGTTLLAGGLITAGLFLATDSSNNSRNSVKPSKNIPGQKSPQKAQTKNVDREQTLKDALMHAYIPGSIKLTRAAINGDGAMSNYYPAKRESVQAHIDYKTSKNNELLAIDGDPLPPKEVVLDANNSTRPGVINWATYPPANEVNMQVELSPYQGNATVNKQYRLYLAAMSLDERNGRPLASEFYAGTVNISGAHGNIESIKVEQEPNIPLVKLLQPNTAAELYGAPNDDPHNG